LNEVKFRHQPATAGSFNRREYDILLITVNDLPVRLLTQSFRRAPYELFE